MRIIIVVAFLIGIATMACAPSATTSESESNTTPEKPREPSPSLLLDEQSAIGILQSYLQQCLLNGHRRQKESWLMDLATGTIGDIDWSASHHEISTVPGVFSRKGTAVEVESWVVVGPGLQRAGGESSATHGRWQVYAGHQRARYLDVPARLALEEYDIYDSCPQDPFIWK